VPKERKERIEVGAILSGGLAAAAFALVLHLLQIDHLNSYGFSALVALCVSLPLLLISYAKYKLERASERNPNRPLAYVLAAGSMFVTVGFALTIWQASQMAAFAFILVALAVVSLEARL
jgi:hypothetical protein